MCRNFLWSGNKDFSMKVPIAWDEVCNTKKVGGLNNISLQECKPSTITNGTFKLKLTSFG